MATTSTQPTKPTGLTNTPGTLVLQWLTYAFWGWTILALAWLTAISVGFYLDRNSASGSEVTVVAYSLAAVIVLFIISLICDIFYTRREPTEKHGASTLIMIIHAVIFALFGIGSLIVAVFAVVRLLIGDGSGSYGNSGALTTLITGLVIAVVYGATLLRTLRPFKLKNSSLLYWLFMALVTIAITALAIVGPTWSASETRDDRLIERGLPELSEAIRTHAAKSDTLPGNLSEVRDRASADAKSLIDRNLVEYKPGGEVVDGPEGSTPELFDNISRGFEYTLCVNYKAKKGDGSMYTDAKYQVGRDIMPNTYQHDAGRVCYDLVTNYAY